MEKIFHEMLKLKKERTKKERMGINISIVKIKLEVKSTKRKKFILTVDTFL